MRYIITEERLRGLLNNEQFLYALEGAGVDNWEGYEYAEPDVYDAVPDGLEGIEVYE